MIAIEMTYRDLVDRLAPGRRIGEGSTSKHRCFIETPSGYSLIDAVIEKPETRVIEVEFSNGKRFQCSEQHLFSRHGMPVTAASAKTVDTAKGETTVVSRKFVANETVFDISIESPHWYVCGPSPDEPIHHNTYLTLGVVKHYLEEDKDAVICLFESESAISKDMLIARGIDVERVAVFPVTTVEQFRDESLRIVTAHLEIPEKERPKLMFVLDSLGMLSTNKEIQEALASSGTKDMTRAALIKSAFRVLTLKLGHANIPLLVTNHVYAAIGSNSPLPESGGGGGFKYAVSTEITLTKSKYKEGDDQVGIIVTATAKKSRLTVEGTKARVLIRYNGGLDRYFGLVPIAEELGLIKKEMGRYVMPDGKKVYEKSIVDSPHTLFTKEVLDRIDTWTKENFTYGAGKSNAIVNISGEE